MMGEVNENGAGKGDAPQTPQTPGAPATPPAVAGEGAAGEGAGKGEGAAAFTPEQHALVTKAQQEAADYRRAAEFYREQAAAGPSAPAPEVDQVQAEAQSEFDRYAEASGILKHQQTVNRNVQAQLMDTQMRTRAAEFPDYAAVQGKVIADLRQLGDIPVENLDRAMKMVYASHASTLVNGRNSAQSTEIALLKARLAAVEGQATKAGVDVGALQTQGGAVAAPQEIAEPGPNATAAELGAYIDAVRAQRGY